MAVTVTNVSARTQLLLNNGTDSQGNVSTKSMTVFSTAMTNEDVATNSTASNAMMNILDKIAPILLNAVYRYRIVTTSDMSV